GRERQVRAMRLDAPDGDERARRGLREHGGDLLGRERGEVEERGVDHRARSALRSILPRSFFGRSLTNSITRGYLCFARRAFTNSWSSLALAFAPSRSTTNAFGFVRPSSSTPITAAMATASCFIKHSSTSSGETQRPLTLR